jgi:hypothetical protein
VPPDPAQPAVTSAMAVAPTINFVQRFTSLPSLPRPASVPSPHQWCRPSGSDLVV